MYNLKKMLSNDPTANDKSNDLIRKTPSSRKLRVPAQGKLTEIKCIVKMANVKTEFRMGFMVLPSLLIVGIRESREDDDDVQLDKSSKIPEQTRYHGEYFGGTEGPTKVTRLLNTLNVSEFSYLLFPFSPV